MSSTLAHAWAGLRRQARLVCRHARYGSASWSPVASAHKTSALEHLFRVVNRHLRDLDVEYVLAYGTLLGWFREQRLLPHDYDVDFGAPVAAYPRIRDSAARLPRGFTLHDTSHRHPGPKLYVAYRGWEADLYFFEENAGTMRSLERSQNPGEYLPFPREFFHPRQPAQFLGESTFVPAQPGALLKHHYRYLGPDAVRDPITRYFRSRSG